MSLFDSLQLIRPYSTILNGAFIHSPSLFYPRSWTIAISSPRHCYSFYSLLLVTLIFSNQQLILVSADASLESPGSFERRIMGGHPEKPSYCQRHRRDQPSTFLWRIKRQPAAYFFGTIHVPYKEVWDYISVYAKEAFRSADTIFLELVLTNPLTLRQLAMCQLLPGDEHLRDHIPTEMYERLQRLMEKMKKALPTLIDETDVAWSHSPSYIDYMFEEIIGNWYRKRPVWVMTMLDSLSLDTFRHRGEPTLDLYLAQEASMFSKSLGAIESVQEQCHPLNSLDKKHALIALNRTLARQEALDASGVFSSSSEADGRANGRTVVRDLIENYNCGSLNETIFARSSTLPEDPNSGGEEADFDIDYYFRHELIDKRNERMAERVLRLLESDPEKSFFFAFGAAHFIGAKSVVELVRQAGYEVEAVPIAGWYDEDTVIARRSKHRQSSTQNNNKQQRKQRERKPNPRRQRPNSQITRASERDEDNPFPMSSTPRQRIFQELWVRMDGYTPRPSSPRRPVAAESPRKRLSSLLVADTPQSYVVLQYHYHAASAGRRSVGKSIQAFIICLAVAICQLSF